METSKQLLKEANITPRLRLGQKTKNGVVSTGEHRVKIIKDKLDKGTDYSGKEIEVVKYLVEEDGQYKSYSVPKLGKNGELHYLVQRLAEIKEGAEIIIKMEKRGVKNVITVSEIGRTDTIEYEDEEEKEEAGEDGKQINETKDNPF